METDQCWHLYHGHTLQLMNIPYNSAMTMSIADGHQHQAKHQPETTFLHFLCYVSHLGRLVLRNVCNSDEPDIRTCALYSIVLSTLVTAGRVFQPYSPITSLHTWVHSSWERTRLYQQVPDLAYVFPQREPHQCLHWCHRHILHHGQHGLQASLLGAWDTHTLSTT